MAMPAQPARLHPDHPVRFVTRSRSPLMWRRCHAATTVCGLPTSPSSDHACAAAQLQGGAPTRASFARSPGSVGSGIPAASEINEF